MNTNLISLKKNNLLVRTDSDLRFMFVEVKLITAPLH